MKNKKKNLIEVNQSVSDFRHSLRERKKALLANIAKERMEIANINKVLKVTFNFSSDTGINLGANLSISSARKKTRYKFTGPTMCLKILQQIIRPGGKSSVTGKEIPAMIMREFNCAVPIGTVAGSLTVLRQAGIADTDGKGHWTLTEKGQTYDPANT